MWWRTLRAEREPVSVRARQLRLLTIGAFDACTSVAAVLNWPSHVIAALVAAAVVGCTVATPAQTAGGTAQTVSGSGVGAVKLGKTYKKLREQELIGKIRRGCELGGPNTRSARLRAPVKGGVDFTLTSPRKVTTITITGGAATRGVGIGDTIKDIKKAFKKAKIDRSTEAVFGITLVKVPKDDGGRFQFAVDVDSNRITVIGIPQLAFCE